MAQPATFNFYRCWCCMPAPLGWLLINKNELCSISSQHPPHCRRLMCQRRRFRTVQDPFILALARENASPCNMHPDVLAGVEATNKGIKQKLSERKADVYWPNKNSRAIQGRTRRWNISTILKRRDLPGQMYYLTMGSWIRTTRASNIHGIVKKNNLLVWVQSWETFFSE